jgi:hypothetical protein
VVRIASYGSIRLICLSLLCLLLSASEDVSGGPKHDNIRGYKYSNVEWLLGQDVAEVNLEYFDDPYYSADDDYMIYHCNNRRLRFGASSADCLVTLMARDGVIYGISLIVGYEQVSKKKLLSYYKGLRAGCEIERQNEDYIRWVDFEGDLMAMQPFYVDSGAEVGTLVVYGRQPPGDDQDSSLPDWLRRARGAE